MNELEQALQAYRSEVKPSSQRREALESAVLGATPAAAGALTTVLAVMLGAAIGGSVLAVILAARPETPPSPPPVSAPSELAPRPSVPAPASAVVEPPPPVVEPTPEVTTAPHPSVGPTRAPSRSTAPRTDPEPLEDMRALRKAERLLDTQPSEALRLLRTHASNYPDSPLAPERGALRVLALCNAGKTAQGATARDAFLRAHPRSPYGTRVKAACVDVD